uniref:Uncharacterized protein n=1 Tax=Tetradesmus obliquus TaxID=3088 RepID=A0A383V9B0_TETOB
MCDLLEHVIRRLQELRQQHREQWQQLQGQQQQQQQQQQQVPGLNSDEAALVLSSAPLSYLQARGGKLAGLERLCSMQCIQEAAGASMITAQLQKALDVFCTPHWMGAFRLCPEPAAAACSSSTGVVRLLLGLPAAARISADQLALCLDKVLVQCADNVLCEALLEELMCSAGRLLDPLQPQALSRLMQHCLRRQTGRGMVACMQLLCRDPAAQQLPASSVFKLLLSALKLRQGPFTVLRVAQMLSQLPAAAQLAADEVAELLSAAMDSESMANRIFINPADTVGQAVHVLCGLPGAHGLQTLQVLQFLEAAILESYYQAIRALCALPGARELQPEQRAALLAVGKVVGCRLDTMMPLVQLPLVPQLAVGGSSSSSSSSRQLLDEQLPSAHFSAGDP